MALDIEKYVVNKKCTVRQAMEVIDVTTKRLVFIVDEKMLIGSLTDGDVRRWILAGGALDGAVTEAMHKTPIILHERETSQANSIMKQNQVSALPIVNNKDEIVDIVFLDGDNIHVKTIVEDVALIIMAGGRGERLMPYTSVLPKPLIPIGEKPIIEHIIDRFRKYGIKEFVLSVNYRKNMLKAFFDEIEREYKVSFVEETKPLGTGGSLFFLKNRIERSFFVSNCDILLDADFESIYRFHKKERNLVTIVTSVKRYVLPYGVINLNDEGFVKSLEEKPSNDYLINTGVYILEPDVLEYIEEEEFLHITQLIDRCISNGMRVGTYPISEESWMDMGQLGDLEKMKLKLEG